MFIFYRQTLIIWTVFAVIKLSDMFKCLTLEQNEVNTPTFDTKQSSSSLQSDKFTSISAFAVWISFTHWQISWKFCFDSLIWLKLITLSFSIFLNSFTKSLIYGESSFDLASEKWVTSWWWANKSQIILMKRSLISFFIKFYWEGMRSEERMNSEDLILLMNSKTERLLRPFNVEQMV